MNKRERGLALLSEGLSAANEVILRAKAQTSLDGDAAALSSALATLRSATNWLETTESFDNAHDALDQAGRARRLLFPHDCTLLYEDGQYHQNCPVALAHNRIGMSVGGTIDVSECSICGQDPEDCPHISGRLYDDVECFRIIKKFSLDHVALVESPDFPDARLMSAPFDSAEIRDVLGDEFVIGTQVSCDRCLSECSGVAWPFRKETEL